MNKSNVYFNNSEIKTNLGYLSEEGHEEPWIIAMNSTPNKNEILEYSKRWGIECMFSDLESRGFNLENTHLEDTKRLENLILILAIGSYWANSVGFAETNRIKKKKLIRKNSIKNFLRSKVSNFKKGLRIIINLALNLCFSHDLWCCLS